MKKMYVQEVINYIEEHINESLSMDLIANYIGYSKYYLHRLFYIYTGLNIMDYVRKRKLEYAMIDLQTDLPIIDIAVKYGFNSRRSFSRAFYNTYGESPSNLRNNTKTLSTKLKLNQLGGIKMLSYLSDSMVVSISKLHVLSHCIISNQPEHNVIDFMTEYKLKHNLHVLTEVGFDIPVTQEESQQGLRGYEYWLILSAEEYSTFNGETVKKHTVPASKYLMLTINDPFVDPFERIPNGWKKLASNLEHNYEFNNTLNIGGLEEKIDTLFNTSMNIYIPIK